MQLKKSNTFPKRLRETRKESDKLKGSEGLVKVEPKEVIEGGREPRLQYVTDLTDMSVQKVAEKVKKFRHF